jgi:hypothetical protein
MSALALARLRHPLFAVAALVVATYFLFVPALISIHDLSDPAVRTGQIPAAGWRLFRKLTPTYERWARGRLASGRAGQLGVDDIAGTEWPVFGSVFYLWGVESLQAVWEDDHGVAATEPRLFARGAVEASVTLILDEGHATWVKRHWGASYLDRANAFYRALRIAAMSAHVRLTGERTYVEQLGRESSKLALEIAESPHGLLEDYPGQCYPSDVLVALAILRRASLVLGTDDRMEVQRGLRAFQDNHLDVHGLVPYACDIATGNPMGEARGCSNSYVLLFAAELWPEQAQAWYARHEHYFWQWQHGVAGFREFPADRMDGDWYMDVDSGPVVAGHGVAASAFGLGAAIVAGRQDHAVPMLAELFAISWPLPGGTLLLPRLLSNTTDAPYLGEAGILYILSRQPRKAQPQPSADRGFPGLVYAALGAQLLLGGLLAAFAVRSLRNWRRYARQE